MDLRTKLVFALVAVSLASMLALGAAAYRLASEFLTDKTERQLISLAETKKDDLEKVIKGWKERVSLIASRTQLRESLKNYNETLSSEHQRRIWRILSDARLSVDAFHSLAVYDIENRLVAAAGVAPDHQHTSLPAARLTAGDTISAPQILFSDDNELLADFVAPMTLNAERIGSLHVVSRAQELIELTESVTGLGETGETMIVLRDASGTTRMLHSARHTSDQRGAVLEGPDDPAERALRGEPGPFTEGLVDYRGEQVWVATRLLEEVGWGVVVKFDAAEEHEPILEFRRRLTRLGLSLSAFAILLGVFLGLRFAKPIHQLAGVANRIRLGELDARAEVAREDEIGLLARTFNQMAEELEQRMTLLREFQKYFDVSLDMLCIADTDGYFKRVNPAFERILGWSTQELLSRPFIDFVHPDDVEPTLREVEKLAHGIPTISFENRYRCADGTYKHLLWNSYPEPQTGVLYAIARDVTELKQVHERLQAADERKSSDQTPPNSAAT